jgi:hypothetical protein
VENRQLRINADAWRGQIRAELLDAESGRALSGFGLDDCLPVAVDGIDEPVRWRQKADLSALMGRTVRFRFAILRGELYSFWLAP